jgi:hypothetical protein
MLQSQFRPADGRCFTSANKVRDVIGECPACRELLFTRLSRLRSCGKQR